MKNLSQKLLQRLDRDDYCNIEKFDTVSMVKFSSKLNKIIGAKYEERSYAESLNFPL